MRTRAEWYNLRQQSFKGEKPVILKRGKVKLGAEK
jgi:hypothetical protein